MMELLQMLFPDKNELVTRLQDKYARMSFEQLARITQDEWDLIDKIFDVDTQILMRKMAVKILVNK